MDRRWFLGRKPRHGYNQDCQDHADRMMELSALYTEREWLKNRSEVVEMRIKELKNRGALR